MSISGIQGQILEVTVVQCTSLKNTEFISKQDPYVYVEYGDAKFRTRTCTDGGKNPTFQEKFVFTLIEGRLEINVNVWNSNTFSVDDHIVSGKSSVKDKMIHPGLSSAKEEGEVKLIMHYKNLTKHPNTRAMPFSSYPPPSGPPQSYPAAYAQPPPCAYPSLSCCPYHTPPMPPYHPPPVPMSSYPPAPYPPQPVVYPPPPYPPTTYPPATYPPAPYPGQCSGAYPPY